MAEFVSMQENDGLSVDDRFEFAHEHLKRYVLELEASTDARRLAHARNVAELVSPGERNGK